MLVQTQIVTRSAAADLGSTLTTIILVVGAAWGGTKVILRPAFLKLHEWATREVFGERMKVLDATIEEVRLIRRDDLPRIENLAGAALAVGNRTEDAVRAIDVALREYAEKVGELRGAQSAQAHYPPPQPVKA